MLSLQISCHTWCCFIYYCCTCTLLASISVHALDVLAPAVHALFLPSLILHALDVLALAAHALFLPALASYP